jgi:hypothetical protein
MLQQQLNPVQEDVTETGTFWIDLHELVLQCVSFCGKQEITVFALVGEVKLFWLLSFPFTRIRRLSSQLTIIDSCGCLFLLAGDIPNYVDHILVDSLVNAHHAHVFLAAPLGGTL